jgi:predicted nucleic acid-binding protein
VIVLETSGVLAAVGLTDASLVVLAGRYATQDVLTLDERHFRALRDRKGRPFRVLPADA